MLDKNRGATCKVQTNAKFAFPHSSLDINELNDGEYIRVVCGRARVNVIIESDPKCTIFWFATAKGTRRGRGVGTEAYTELEKFMNKSMGCKRASLSPLTKDAERFWKKQGFRCTRRDCYSMTKRLKRVR